MADRKNQQSAKDKLRPHRSVNQFAPAIGTPFPINRRGTLAAISERMAHATPPITSFHSGKKSKKPKSTNAS